MTADIVAPKGFADKVIFGAVAAVFSALFAGLIALLIYLVAAVNNLSLQIQRLDTVISENRQERQNQIDDMRARMNRLEDRRP